MVEYPHLVPMMIDDSIEVYTVYDDQNEPQVAVEHHSIADLSENETTLLRHITCDCHTLNLIANTDFINMLKQPQFLQIKLKHNQFMGKANILWSAMQRPRLPEN